jgi:phosphatidylglycerophosphatase C
MANLPVRKPPSEVLKKGRAEMTPMGTPDPTDPVASHSPELLRGDEEPGHRPIVAFDFDGTITRKDSLPLFLTRIRSRRELLRCFAHRAPQLAQAVRGGSARDHAKELVCLDVLGGLTCEQADSAAAETARVVQQSLIRSDTGTRIRWHQAAGHRIIVVSASFEAYVTLVAASLGIDEVIATKWHVDPASNVLTGRLDGLNVRGEAKVDLLEAHLKGPCDLDYAYGNSGGDTAMLARAKHPVRVGRRQMPELFLEPPAGAVS